MVCNDYERKVEDFSEWVQDENFFMHRMLAGQPAWRPVYPTNQVACWGVNL